MQAAYPDISPSLLNNIYYPMRASIDPTGRVVFRPKISSALNLYQYLLSLQYWAYLSDQRLATMKLLTLVNLTLTSLSKSLESPIHLLTSLNLSAYANNPTILARLSAQKRTAQTIINAYNA
jgi:hypothetical protein